MDKFFGAQRSLGARYRKQECLSLPNKLTLQRFFRRYKVHELDQ